MTYTTRTGAFSLIELVIVLAILGILAVVAASRVLDIKSDSQINTTMTEANRLNRLAMIARERLGRWPNDAMNGTVPADLRPVLFATTFRTTPSGGEWDWNGPGTTIPHWGMAVHFATSSAEPSGQYAKLDAKFDDGNASTGKIRRFVSGNRVSWCFLVQ
jgi:prepilin-type N-terminal cleavage/methylation domain-containing protein